ncbi:hypothetical protein XO10_07175 [Marinitoga sp. 1135]|uniref:HD-GYP domain-containing protein n=1 Tax=Marinitoga piezophila (strain DSM 14283 / JCM 11233 / KA3) TaxID=443254 RepID=H2J3W0_MARPK|nr:MULTISPECIES: HD-GYP domain-containing protein [Marinitoga]AEX85852.1 HD-GYP domain-containing protein [Marinitoga piezophila KA3]APT76290.1 hypothetical protein LN42_07770 [Marinitoga sp. 1137]NUU96055.1 hypothetical protein [Marinitoga sp. 1135]NUU97966.1 hypothetical protein [Marinitoga sp. 1138]
MKFLPLNKIKSGMILAMDVKDIDGNIIFKKGKVIDSNVLNTLQKNNILKVPINELKRKSAQSVQNIKEMAYTHSFLSKEVLERSFSQVKDLFAELEKGGDVDIDKATEVASTVTDEMQKNFSDKIYIPLKKLKTYDEYLYSHSLNVMILGSLIGFEAGIRGDELTELALSGLLHDIGKTKVDLEILNAPRKLSAEEFEVMKKHVMYTKEILENNRFVSDKILRGAIEHHERYDGTGYFFKKKGKDISEFGRILALADVYDALTSKRVYKDPWTPYKTLSFILSHVTKSFDPEYTQHLINAFGLFPAGMVVQLSNNKIGIVVASNKANKMKPIVKIDDELVDTAEDKTLRIVKILGYKYIDED